MGIRYTIWDDVTWPTNDWLLHVIAMLDSYLPYSSHIPGIFLDPYVYRYLHIHDVPSGHHSHLGRPPRRVLGLAIWVPIDGNPHAYHTGYGAPQ